METDLIIKDLVKSMPDMKIPKEDLPVIIEGIKNPDKWVSTSPISNIPKAASGGKCVINNTTERNFINYEN